MFLPRGISRGFIAEKKIVKKMNWKIVKNNGENKTRIWRFKSLIENDRLDTSDNFYLIGYFVHLEPIIKFEFCLTFGNLLIEKADFSYPVHNKIVIHKHRASIIMGDKEEYEPPSYVEWEKNERNEIVIKLLKEWNIVVEEKNYFPDYEDVKKE